MYLFAWKFISSFALFRAAAEREKKNECVQHEQRPNRNGSELKVRK